MRKIAISDIHGCSATFNALLHRLELTASDQLFLLGDYIDRGPDSKQVLDTIFNLQESGFQVQCLKGNHEELLLWAIDGHHHGLENFLRNGGEETLASFDAHHPGDIPSRYLDFIKNLPSWIESDEYIFVHAGLHFVPGLDPLSEPEKMLWVRNWYNSIDYAWLGDRYLVHGHTPMPKNNIRQMFGQFAAIRVLDIDAGCVFDLPGYGHLCACDLSNRLLYFEPRSDQP